MLKRIVRGVWHQAPARENDDETILLTANTGADSYADLWLYRWLYMAEGDDY
jgi:hypothetical protein